MPYSAIFDNISLQVEIIINISQYNMKKNILIAVMLIIGAALVGTAAYMMQATKDADNRAQMPIIQTVDPGCEDEPEGEPVITSISVISGSVGTKLEIQGCNFAGFEGDKTAWIENEQGVKGILYGDEQSTSKILNFTLKSPLCQKDTSYSGLPCDAWLTLAPGKYLIYVLPWGKQSNKVEFTVR